MELTEREIKLCNACTDYAENHAEAGLPGHNLMMLLNKFMDENAKLTHDLEMARVMYEDRGEALEILHITIAQKNKQIEELEEQKGCWME